MRLGAAGTQLAELDRVQYALSSRGQGAVRAANPQRSGLGGTSPWHEDSQPPALRGSLAQNWAEGRGERAKSLGVGAAPLVAGDPSPLPAGRMMGSQRHSALAPRCAAFSIYRICT